MDDKKKDRLAKKLGEDTVKEMEAMDSAALKKTIVEANGAMQQAKDELNANEAYVSAKNDVSLLSSGKREVDARQKARIEMALELLKSFSQ